MAVRIRGLVKAARVCRESLARGIPPGEREDFLAWVRGILDQVEGMCRDSPRGVEDLPRPSREAYRFLEKVSLGGLEGLSASPGPELLPPRVRAPGLVSFLEEMLVDLGTWGDLSHSLDGYKRLAKGKVESVERGLGRKGLDPSFLPERTGMAFAWLDWLSRGDHLEFYLSRVVVFLPALEDISDARWGYSDPVGVLFYPFRYIYRVKEEDGLLLWRLHCGFLLAEDPEVEDFLLLVCLGKNRVDPQVYQDYKDFLASPRFFSLAREVEAVLGGPGRDRPRGRAWDLEALFKKINQEYFGGTLVKPRLSWGERFSRNRLGGYDRQRNRIFLSPVLDDPALPEFVPAYVLFHEMLHLQQQGRVVGGRLMSHTASFRVREDRFRHKEQALRWIEKCLGEEAGKGG